MGKRDRLFLSLLVGWLVLAFGGVKLPDLLPNVLPDREPLIGIDGLAVLIIHETSQTLAPDQLQILTDPLWQGYVGGLGGEYRVFDPDTEFMDPASPWSVAMQRPRESLPWVIVSSSRGGYEGPLPETAAEMHDLIKEWAG